MAGDRQMYALNVEFALQDMASAQLEIVDQHLGKIEQQIGQIAGRAMGSLTTATTQLNTALMDMAKQYEKINAASTAILKPARESSAISDRNHEKLAKEAFVLKKDIVGVFDELIKILEKKEGLFKTENQLIEKEGKAVKEVSKELGSWVNVIGRVTERLESFVRDLFNIVGAISEAVAATEMFRTANYRLYGSQTELVAAGHQIALQYGVMRQQALEALAVLGNLRVPIEQLEKLTETAVKFHRLSGVNIQTTAEWQKNMLAMGLSGAEVERRMVHMAVAMRRFGLDTNDVTGLIRTQQEQGQQLRNVFGDKTASEIQRAQTAIAAFAKELNMTPESIRSVSAALGTIEPWRLDMLGSSAGISAAEMRTAEGQTKFMAIASARLAEQLRGATSEMQRQALLQIAQGQYGAQLGQAVFNLAQQQNSATSAIKNGVDAEKAMARALNAHISEAKDLNKIYEESGNTIPFQMQKLQNAFYAAFNVIWSHVEPAVIVFLIWVNTAIHWIGQLIVTIGEWLDSMGPTGTVIKYIAAGVMMAVAAFVALSVTLQAFGSLMVLSTSIGRALGAAIEQTLMGMARGMAALAPHMLTMLSLSLLFLSMGIGAFLFAMAVVKIAEHGTAGVKAILALTVALVTMALGLALAGYIAQSAILGLLGVALVLVAAGVAALILAYAVQMLAEVGAGSTGALFALALAIAVLGLALVGVAALGALVLPAIIPVAVGILLIAAAALIMAFAMKVAVSAMEKMNAGLALNVLNFALIMVASSAALWFAGLILIVAATVLVVAGIILLVAGVLIGAAGLLIGYGGVHMLVGAAAIAIAAPLMIIGGVALILGSTILLVGAFIAAAAAIMMLPAAVVLLAAGLVLLIAGAVIGVAGLLILIGGVGFYLGSLLLSMAAPLLLGASWRLAAASAPMVLAAGPLLFGSMAIGVAGLYLLVAGLIIFMGGLLLFVGAVLLIAGAAMIIASAWMLSKAGSMLVRGAPDLAMGSMALVPVAFVLMFVAGVLFVPAVLLAVIGILLLIAGVGVLLGGMMIRAGAWFLSGAGKLLVNSARDLTLGAIFMIPASILLAAVGIILLVAGVLILAGSLLLLLGGAAFLVAAMAIAAGAVFFEVAAEIFDEWAESFLTSSLFLFFSGLAFAAAAVLFAVGAAIMLPTAVLLVATGAAMYAASWPMARAGDALLGVSLKMLSASTNIYNSGLMVHIGSQMLMAAIRTFSTEYEAASTRLFESFDDTLARFDNYADRLEASAKRIAAALRSVTPVIPQSSYIMQLVASQPFVSSRTRDSSDMFLDKEHKAADARQQRLMLEELKKIIGKLDEIDKSIKGVDQKSGVGKTTADILAALSEYLPEIADKSRGRMGGSMGDWAGG